LIRIYNNTYTKSFERISWKLGCYLKFSAGALSDFSDKQYLSAINNTPR